MTHGDKRRKFTHDIALLILHAYELGYEVALDFVRRCKECEIGIDGFHQKSLAADIHLYRDKKYLRATKAHYVLGLYWKSLDPNNTWGGDFRKKDGNHYSRGEGR